jgi:predicted O-methyltransferase YrrM
MYNHFQLGIKYLGYLLKASNGKGHGVHSPFVFDFIESVLLPSGKTTAAFSKIEQIRKKYSKDVSSFLEVEDLGAGSFLKAGSRRSIAQIANGAAKHPKFARLLYYMVNHYKVDDVLELGTSLGLTTRYLALAGNQVTVQTIEGANSIAAFTSNALHGEGYLNIKQLTGDFKDVLPQALVNMKGRKLIFFDGNHQYTPTVAYFKQVVAVCDEYDILVFDDIHWSKGMEKAWKEIKNSEGVTCSIDLFFIGIVFLRKEFKEKLDFTIRF